MNKLNHRVQKYSIRKFALGAASVMIGAFMYITMGNGQVMAATDTDQVEMVSVQEEDEEISTVVDEILEEAQSETVVLDASTLQEEVVEEVQTNETESVEASEVATTIAQENEVTITLDESGVDVSSDEGVSIVDSVLTITKSGIYTITGSGESYTLQVNRDVEATLILDAITLTNSNIISDGNLTILVTSDSSIYSDTTNAIEASGTLTIMSENGAVLTASSSAKHAIKANAVVLEGANLVLSSDSKDGIHATTDVTITDSNVTITSGDDGIQVEDETDVNGGDVSIVDSTITITSADKGITVNDTLTIDGDSIVTIDAADEGLEGRAIYLFGGVILIESGDDGINASEWTDKENADLSSLTNTVADIENELGITIDGATVTVNAAGDGIDSNGNVTILSGDVYVTQTGVADAAIDYDGTGIIQGGTVWAIGNQGMAQAFMTGSSQSYIIVNVMGNSGDTITVLDSQGNVVATTTATNSFGNVVFSSNDLVSEQTYTITTSSGSSVTATATESTSQNVFQPGNMGQMPGDGNMMMPMDFTGQTPLEGGQFMGFNGQMPPEFNGQTPPEMSTESTTDASSTQETPPELPTEMSGQTPPEMSTQTTTDASSTQVSLPELPTEFSGQTPPEMSGQTTTDGSNTQDTPPELPTETTQSSQDTSTTNDEVQTSVGGTMIPAMIGLSSSVGSIFGLSHMRRKRKESE